MVCVSFSSPFKILSGKKGPGSPPDRITVGLGTGGPLESL